MNLVQIVILFHSGGAQSLHQYQQPGAVEGNEARSQEETGASDDDFRGKTFCSSAVRRLDNKLNNQLIIVESKTQSLLRHWCL